jgi:hypothetical protein
MIQSQSNARRMCATFHCIIWDHGTVILCNKSVIEVATLETFIRGGWAFGNWKHLMKKKHTKNEHGSRLSLPKAKSEGWLIFFPRSAGGGASRRSPSLNSPLSFQLCATLSLFLSIQSSMSHRQHLESRPGCATWLDIYTHTIPSEREAGPAVNKLARSVLPRPTTTTSRRNII